MRLVALALALLLAGCAAPAALDPQAQAPALAPAPAPAEAMLMPCTEHAVDAPVDAAEAQKHLPQGMKPRPMFPGGPPVLEVVAVACGEAERPLRAVFVWMLVEPPADLKAPGIAGFTFTFAAVTDDPTLAATLRAAGVPVSLGTTSLSTSATPVSVMGEGKGATDAWSVAVESLVPKREQLRSHPVIRSFVGDATGVTHAVDIDGGSHPHHEFGEGRIVVTGDAPFPVPRAPGVSIHGVQGHLGFRLVGPDALRDAEL